MSSVRSVTDRSEIVSRFHPCIECIEFSKSKVKEIEMKVMRRWWNVTLFTRKIEKHSRHPSLQGSDSRPARKIGKVENEWIDEDDRIERDIAYQREGRTERLAGKRSSILENRKNVDYIPFFEPCLNKEARLSN